MAESLVRLKVESQEYDAKLKRATEGLQRYADGCRKIGGTLEVVEKETLDYVKAVGQMETVSKSATGRLAEMKKTFTELSVQYNRLTDQEKNSPFGQALSSSLGQLRSRITATQSEIDGINKSLGSGGLGGALDSLAGKFGMSIQSLAGWGAAIKAAQVALDVMKDAFFASEANVDEWGRTMDASKSLYEGFLTALNTGDVSGYLGRIDQIVSAARDAYDALDRLGTMKTIQAPAISAQQAENDRMRMMIQTRRYIAPVDGRQGSMKAGQLLTNEQIKRIEQQLQNGLQKVTSLVGNEVKQTSKAIDAVYERQSQELGISLSEFRKGTSSMAEFEKRLQGAAEYQRFEREHTTSQTMNTSAGQTTVTSRDTAVNPYEQYKMWSTFRVDGQRFNDLINLIKQRDQQATQAYGMQAQAYRTINRAEGISARGQSATGRGETGEKTLTETQQNQKAIESLTKEYQDLATAAKTADDIQKAGISERMIAVKGEISQLQSRNDELKKFAEDAKGIQFDNGSLPQLTKQLKDLQQAQSNALNADEWKNYQEQIEQTQHQIDALKGKWQDGMQAIFSTPHVFDVSANTEEVLEQLKEIEGVQLDEKAMTITANTADAYNKVQKLLKDIEGTAIEFNVAPKMEQGVNIQNAEGLKAFIQGIKKNLETADFGTPLYNNLAATLSDANMLQSLVGESLKMGLGTVMFDAADELGRDFWTRAMEGGVENMDWQAIADKINEKRNEAGLDSLSLDFDSGEAKEEKSKSDGNNAQEKANKLLSGLQSVASGLQNIGIKIPDSVQKILTAAQGVMSVIQGVETVISVFQTTTATTQTAAVTGNTIALSALTAAVTANTAALSTNSALNFIPFFARGGIVKHAAYGYRVPGNDFSDNTPVMVSSGELILNRAQQGNIASQLEGSGWRDANLTATLRGEDLILAIDNTSNRQGRGEYVTSKFN